MEMIWETGILIFLGVNSWTDIRKREISLIFTGIFAIAGIIWRLSGKGVSVEILPVAGVGLLFAGISVITKGALGMGDCLVLLALGTVMDMGDFFLMLLVAVFSSAVYSGILLVILKKNRNTEIPFVPFLLMGYLGGVILWG